MTAGTTLSDLSPCTCVESECQARGEPGVRPTVRLTLLPQARVGDGGDIPHLVATATGLNEQP